MNREYKERLSGKVESNFSDLEMRIMQDIVRRIEKAGEITSTADYQINRLLLLGNSSENIENFVKETLGKSYPQMFELYDNVIDREYVREKSVYEQVNAKYVPFAENESLKQLSDALILQTNNELENITQSMGFAVDYGNGKKVFTPLSEIYQGYLDSAMMDIASGAFDYNSVLRKVVGQMTNSGLRTVDYASGYATRAEVAARRAVMSGITKMTASISEYNAEKLGTDYFEVAWHENARPTHRVWQGKVWTKEQLVTICGLGSVTGLEGANCYHERYPFVPGLSERNWPDEWLDEQNKNEDELKKFKGKEYTAYSAVQKQRQMETAMRAQRQKVKLLQDGKADEDDIMLARCKYQGQLDEYSEFSKKMKLKLQRERIYVDMEGRVAPEKSEFNKLEKKLQSRYNKENVLDNIKIYEKDKKLQNSIRSGKVSKNIENGKQGKHIKGHNNYVHGKSYLSISEKEAQDLVNEYAGTGFIWRDGNDRWNHKETVSANRVIGVYVNPVTGKETPTNKFTIHYSKKGTHIVPAKGD